MRVRSFVLVMLEIIKEEALFVNNKWVGIQKKRVGWVSIKIHIHNILL